MSFAKNTSAAEAAFNTPEFQAAFQDALAAYASSVGNPTMLPVANVLKAMAQENLGSRSKKSSAKNSGFKSEVISQFGKNAKWITRPLSECEELLSGLIADEDENAINTMAMFNKQGFGWARFYAPAGTEDNPAARFEIMYIDSVTRDRTNPRFDIDIADIMDEEYVVGTPRTNGWED